MIKTWSSARRATMAADVAEGLQMVCGVLAHKDTHMNLKETWEASTIGVGSFIAVTASVRLCMTSDTLLAVICGVAAVLVFNLWAFYERRAFEAIIYAAGAAAAGGVGFVIVTLSYPYPFAQIPAVVAFSLAHLIALSGAVTAREEGAREHVLVLFLAASPLGIGTIVGGSVLLARRCKAPLLMWIRRALSPFAKAT